MALPVTGGGTPDPRASVPCPRPWTGRTQSTDDWRKETARTSALGWTVPPGQACFPVVSPAAPVSVEPAADCASSRCVGAGVLPGGEAPFAPAATRSTGITLAPEIGAACLLRPPQAHMPASPPRLPAFSFFIYTPGCVSSYPRIYGWCQQQLIPWAIAARVPGQPRHRVAYILQAG